MVTDLAFKASNALRMSRHHLLLVVAAAALACACSVWAQKGEDVNTRSVQGTVTNAGEQPVNGAVVQLANKKTQQIRSFITQDNGTYYFHGLSTDVDYELRADYQGAASTVKKLSSFDSRKKAIINLKLAKK